MGCSSGAACQLYLSSHNARAVSLWCPTGKHPLLAHQLARNPRKNGEGKEVGERENETQRQAAFGQEASSPSRNGVLSNVNKGNALQPHFMYEHATAHMPLSGYNIIFQCRADYLSMEGKWMGENPSANLKWHDSGLKEPACFSFLLLQLHFHSPLREQSNNRRVTSPNRSPYLIHCFDMCSILVP